MKTTNIMQCIGNHLNPLALAVCAVMGLTASPGALGAPLGALVTPTGVTASSTYQARVASHTIDGSGMTPNTPVTLTSTANTDYNNAMWLTDDVTADAWITFDLGGVTTLSGFHLWNYNEGGYAQLRSGIETAKVYYSSDSNLDGSFAGTLAQDYSFTMASGNNTYTGEDYTFTTPVTARYIQIRVLTHFPGGEASYVGLSEIRFAEQVGNTPTETTLARSSGTSTPSTNGTSLSFDVTVSGTISAPSGSVTLKDNCHGGTTLGTANLSPSGSNGICTIITSTLAYGTHDNIVAEYSGDNTYATSFSSALFPAQVVTQGTPTVTVTGTTIFAYNGSPQGPDTATTNGSTGSLSFSYAGTGGTIYAASSTKPTNIGNYTVTATVAEDAPAWFGGPSAATPFAIGGVISFEDVYAQPGDPNPSEPRLGPLPEALAISTGGTLSINSYAGGVSPTFRGFGRAHTGSRGLIPNGVADPILVFTTPTVVSGVWVYQESASDRPWRVSGSTWNGTKWVEQWTSPVFDDAGLAGKWTQVTSGSTTPVTKLTFYGTNLFVDDLTVVIAGGDTTPPDWASGWPKADTLTSTGFTARAKTNETGKAYYLVLAGGASAPSPATVKTTGVSIALTADTEATAAVTGKTPGTAYDVYFVAEDALSNLQTATAKVSITTLTAFAQWAKDKGLSGDDALIGADPDKDGQNNLLEFALGGSPNSGADNAKVHVLTSTSDYSSDKALMLTIAVRADTDFPVGDHATTTASKDGVKYTIEGSTTLGTFTAPVWTNDMTDSATIAAIAALPPAGTGYVYQSFTLKGSEVPASMPKGFMRVRVEEP